MVEQLQCSGSYCNIHDVGMSIDDEGGTRPRGRNPWDGFCLRIKALKSISAPELQDRHALRMGAFSLPAQDSYEGGVEDIREMVRQEVNRIMGERAAPAPKRQQRKGGTPL